MICCRQLNPVDLCMLWVSFGGLLCYSILLFTSVLGSLSALQRDELIDHFVCICERKLSSGVL